MSHILHASSGYNLYICLPCQARSFLGAQRFYHPSTWASSWISICYVAEEPTLLHFWETAQGHDKDIISASIWLELDASTQKESLQGLGIFSLASYFINICTHSSAPLGSGRKQADLNWAFLFHVCVWRVDGKEINCHAGPAFLLRGARQLSVGCGVCCGGPRAFFPSAFPPLCSGLETRLLPSL